MGEDCYEYLAFFNEQLICTELNTFPEALLYIIGLHFTLNIRSQKEIQVTMELIQRYFLQIYTQSNRGQKITVAKMSKVFKLLAELNS